ncbi:hypothetical protein EGM97_02320 [Pseudomonas sp. AF32]|uniref:Tc toxin subunit A n=1 Tax=Pseudomonas sp. AF32 TaxID=554390 RepID=UPI001EEF403A|nr:Tc toxin subunit A [Pseudomonas sp. AF32]MCG6573539.1 hypothetical protein [Pseudomonas sp. AF32]
MKDSPARIASRFCEQLLAGRQSEPLSDLEQYFAAGGSVCALARKGVAGLVSEYELEREDAEALALRLNGLATRVLRSFIEDQLTRHEPLPSYLRQGVLALVDGPTYEGLFKPNFGNKCPSDAIEAIHSPVAYAVWLKHWSQRRLVPSEANDAYALTLRRKDLDLLRIDPVTTHRVVSSVEVVSAVLEKSIADSLGGGGNLDEKLSRRRYPNGLPYHHPWTTLNELTRDLGISVGTVVRWCDPAFPYFLRTLPWGETSAHALTQAARLSPALRQLMLEVSPFPDGDQDSYFKENFATRTDIESQNLNQTFFFNLRTQLTQSGLEALLSVELFAPTLSEHALMLDAQITPGHSGSVFVNNGLTAPSMRIRYGGRPFTNNITELIDGGMFRTDRIDRLNRKIRLDNALGLPSHETDALLSAIIGAELNAAALASGSSQTQPPDYWMTGSTVRALGLFRMLQEDYQCTAEAFAVFVGDISVFGRGSELSQFDRVFNRDTLSTPALLMDDGAFALVPETEADALTVAQICGGLNIDLATYFNLAPLIASAQELTELKRSLPVLSGFYRMARLPQLLGVAPNVAVEILKRLSGASGLVALLGQPVISADGQAADVLAAIQRLEGWVRWCADNKLDVAWTVEHTQSVSAPTEPSQAQIRLFDQLRSQLAPALFTEAALRMAGVAPLSNDRQWTQQLYELADLHGLVIHRSESVDLPYENYAREMVERIVRQATDRDDPQTVEQIVGVLLSSRASQRSVVQESLGVYGELSSPLALPVLTWSGSTVHEVLSYVAGGPTTVESTRDDRRDDEPGDPFLGMLMGFSYRSDVVKTLKLSAEFLALYLAIGDGVEAAPANAPFTPSALYYLTVYNRAVALSQKPESQLLDYLRVVNGLPNDLSGDGLRLVQAHTAELLAELFDWSAEEVRACADRVNPGQGYIRSLQHLDLLTRLRGFSLQSTLDASTILKMGLLTPDASFSAYQALADQVTAQLADPHRTSPLYGLHAAGDRVEVQTTIDRTELVANSNQTAQLTVTVTLAGVPQKNVNVYWTSRSCRIDPPKSTTTEHGEATVTVHAGATMGRDLISYRLDAREPQPAVMITLGNDPSTFRFLPVDGEFRVEKEKVGTDVTLRVLMRDRYGNPAADEAVSWELKPLFPIPVLGAINAEGMAQVTFTSLEETQIPEPKVIKDDAEHLFRAIEFIP